MVVVVEEVAGDCVVDEELRKTCWSFFAFLEQACQIMVVTNDLMIEQLIII